MKWKENLRAQEAKAQVEPDSVLCALPGMWAKIEARLSEWAPALEGHLIWTIIPGPDPFPLRCVTLEGLPDEVRAGVLDAWYDQMPEMAVDVVESIFTETPTGYRWEVNDD